VLGRVLIKFGFIGVFTVPPAKEIEGLGQPLLSRVNHFLWGVFFLRKRKGTSAFEMVLSPLPRTALGCMKILGYQKLFWFKALLNAGVGNNSTFF
jgi:hypothetical protein